MSVRVESVIQSWIERRHHVTRRLRSNLATYVLEGQPSSVIVAPIIYSLIVPFAVLDAWVTFYQWVCFPLCAIARVRRRPFLVMDRHQLSYLNAIEKANCTFCSYVNGLIAYVREVAARTEQYWCPIKHDRVIPAPHAPYRRFVAYGRCSGILARCAGRCRIRPRAMARRPRSRR
jgi:hypothetical protein